MTGAAEATGDGASATGTIGAEVTTGEVSAVGVAGGKVTAGKLAARGASAGRGTGCVMLNTNWPEALVSCDTYPSFSSITMDESIGFGCQLCQPECEPCAT